MGDRATAGRRGRARGNRTENIVAAELRIAGWVVASMRQSAGGGDLMAARFYAEEEIVTWEAGPMRMLPTAEVRLIEVKATAGSPFERFGPADRAAMLEVAERAGARAWLAYRPPASVTRWIPSEEWPS